MASVKPPFHGIGSVFNCLTERIYFVVGDYSYEVVYQGQGAAWTFTSETLLGEGSERRDFDGAVMYPESLCERLKRAAEFVQAWYDVTVDCRVGTSAFDRWAPGTSTSH